MLSRRIACFFLLANGWLAVCLMYFSALSIKKTGSRGGNPVFPGLLADDCSSASHCDWNRSFAVMFLTTFTNCKLHLANRQGTFGAAPRTPKGVVCIVAINIEAQNVES